MTDKSFRDLSKEVNDLSVSMAELRGSIKTAKWIIGFLLPALLAAIGWIFVSINGLNQNMATLGISKTASLIGNSKSPQQVQQSLSVVAAKANLIRVSGKIPAKNEVKQIEEASKSILSAVDKYPQYPESWQAASALVNLRSISTQPLNLPPDVARMANRPLNVPPGGPCLSTPPGVVGGIPPSGILTVHLYFRECWLRLDDQSAFDQFRKTMDPRTTAIELVLVRVKILYNGGPVIPVQGLATYGCEFDFNVPDAPPNRGKDLLEAILAKDFSSQNLQIGIPGV